MAAPVDAERRRRRRRGRPGARRALPPACGSVRRLLRPPGAERLEGVPERGLRRGLVERLVDVGGDERLDRRREALDRRRARSRRARSASGNSSSSTNATAALAHRRRRASAARCGARASATRGVLRILGAELEAVRAVDRERIDAQPLERLEHGLPGAAEERDALLDLRRLRRELEENTSASG